MPAIFLFEHGNRSNVRTHVRTYEGFFLESWIRIVTPHYYPFADMLIPVCEIAHVSFFLEPWIRLVSSLLSPRGYVNTDL